MSAIPRSVPEIREILVLETDRLRGAVIARTVSRVFPNARVYSEHLMTAAAQVLAERRIELFLVALRGFDLDVLTLLGVWAQRADPQTRLVIMTPEVNSPAMGAIRSLPVAAVFDSSRADLRELEFACRAVASGRPYWCPALATTAGGLEEPTEAAPVARLGHHGPPRARGARAPRSDV